MKAGEGVEFFLKMREFVCEARGERSSLKAGREVEWNEK